MAALGSLLRLAARGARARRAAGSMGALAAIPRGRHFVERAGMEVRAPAIRAYARATGGDHLFAFYGEGAVAPPFLSATWEPGMALELLAGVDPPLPLGPVVHLGTECTWARALRPGDRVRSRMELERAEPARRGIRLTVASRTWIGEGRLASEATSTFLLRAPVPDPPRAAAEPPRAPETGWTELVRWSLPASAGRSYARVSGDWNPIHLWGATARPFGFRAPILHGYATAARAAHALVDLLFHGDPLALRRMRVGFRAPLALPCTATLFVADHAGVRWFRVAAPDGSALYAEGTFGGAADGGPHPAR
jgi:acyl dehydratase